MITNVIDAKLAVVGGTGIAGLFAQAAMPESADWLKRFTELGSFGLVAFSVFMAFYKIMPLIIAFLDKQSANFVQALKDEREASERANLSTRTEMREIVAAQTAVLSGKLDELKTAVKEKKP